MKVLLVVPPTGEYIRDDRCQAPVGTRMAEPSRAPMDLAYMAACLEQIGMGCKIVDYPAENKHTAHFTSDLQEFQPDMVVIEATIPTLYKDMNMSYWVKKVCPDASIILKGMHLKFFDGKIHPYIDIMLWGEPELVMLNTVRAMQRDMPIGNVSGITFRDDNGEMIKNKEPEFIGDLNILPFPARHLLNNELYRTPDTDEPIAFVETSRGCPYSCIFCAAPSIHGKKVRMRSVESVVDEIEECINKYSIKNFFFKADTFTIEPSWMYSFCDAIREHKLNIRWGANSRADTMSVQLARDMYDAGCYVIGFGAESGSEEMLKKMLKGVPLQQVRDAIHACHFSWIETYGIFIIGLPWETKETLESTKNFILNSDFDFIEVNVAYPMPGTEYYNFALEHSLFAEEDLFSHDYSTPLVKTFELSTEDLAAARREILRAFYLRPKYIFRRLLKIRSIKVFMNYLKWGIKLGRKI